MAMSSSRPYQNSAPAPAAQPFSPAMTTASSPNYSSYGSGSGAGTGAGGVGVHGAGSSYGAGGGMNGGRSAPSSASAQKLQGMNMGMVMGRSESGLSQTSRGGGKSETRETARVHWKALREFLAQWLKDARASAREKLTRLTKLQFQELSTDVYDELMRRLDSETKSADEAVPFLPVREDFHPKRNQARQKLATLPKNRFKDLASDVYFELKRRYPEFEQDEHYDPPPAPGPRVGASSSMSNDRRGATPDISRLHSHTNPGHQRSGSRQLSSSSQGTHRSRPSINNLNGSTSSARDREKGNEMETLHPAGLNTNTHPRGPSPVGATSDVVVPNMSRLREESIEVPYARDSVLEPSPALRIDAGSRASQRARDGGIDRDSQLSAGTSISTRQPNTGNPQEALSPAGTDDARQYYDRMSFSSNVTNKSRLPNRGEMDEDKEQRIRQEYEYKLLDLERRLAAVEHERDDHKRALASEKAKRLEWEEEVRGLKERAMTHASSLRSMQHEVDVQRDKGEAERKMADENVRSAEEETQRWRERAEQLEEDGRRVEVESQGLRERLERVEREGRGREQAGNHEAAVADLRKEVHSLVDELNALSMRNDELIAEREQDAVGMNEMEARVEEYRRKYDAVRIELRNLKATSTMFSPKPISEDHLPASPDGNIADIHVSAFQAGIDTLLTSARSSQPTGVLPAMKAVVEAITAIGEDVKSFEAEPNLDVDASRLESLKHESTTRLSQLMQAARNHAMSSGLSPISLLDGAAGHLSANVVEIIKLLKIRRSVKLGRNRSSMSIKDMVSRDVRDVGAASAAHQQPQHNQLSPLDPNTGLNGSTGGARRDVQRANGNWDREYGPSPVEPPSVTHTRGPSEMLRDDRQQSRASPVPIHPAESMNRTASAASVRSQLAPHASGPPTLAPQIIPGDPSHMLSDSPTPLSATSLRQLPGGSLQEPPSQPLRVNSYQSAASSQSQAKSDSFDLERKASVISSSGQGARAVVESAAVQGQGYGYGQQPQRPPYGTHGDSYQGSYQDRDQYQRSDSRQQQQPSNDQVQTGRLRQEPPVIRRGRISDESSDSSLVGPITARSPSGGGQKIEPKVQEADEDEGHGYADNVGTEEEWDELKPYLNTQSSALVNSIQNLLAAIRTNQQTPALNEHLSEVIAIASSIVAVAGNALPPSLRSEGDALLKELVANTNKLSEAQESAMNGTKGQNQGQPGAAGSAGFGKETRQGIASASFGVAKGLKSLMKLGVE